jgi:dolichol-phosphate mannosyltransferase
MAYPVLIIIITLLIKFLSIGATDLLAEEAYYWNYALHLDIGYLDHPPMVAVLIKLMTTMLGTNEFGVRIASILCWMGTAWFSFKLTELIKPGSGLFSVMLLAILPFFFVHSLVMTPDLPMLVCWSGALFYLYQALVLKQSHAWFSAGVWLGLGLLSKYTIVLLGLSTLAYLITRPDARLWFFKKEPYICLLITVMMFTPVIYWNATHDWVSFAFQSTRRLHDAGSFSFHQLLGLFILFLTPIGVLGFLSIFRNHSVQTALLNKNTTYFLQVFTLVPLSVFSLFSLSHDIKFNWIGPSLLSVIPWLAVLIQSDRGRLRRNWYMTAVILLISYSAMLCCIMTGRPSYANEKLFSKYIAWNDLTHQIYTRALEIEKNTYNTPMIVTLDLYNIASELNFYQTKELKSGNIPKIYPIIGRNLFGENSLMFRYWSKDLDVSGRTLLLVAENLEAFNQPEINSHVKIKSAPQMIWSYSQGLGSKIRPYYYQVVQIKPAKQFASK